MVAIEEHGSSWAAQWQGMPVIRLSNNNHKDSLDYIVANEGEVPRGAYTINQIHAIWLPLSGERAAVFSQLVLAPSTFIVQPLFSCVR